MSMNDLNEIISIFLQRNVNELSDDDLSMTLEDKGKLCSAEELRRIVQSFGSSLFQLRCNKEGIFLVRIEPKINICRDFLDGKCSPQPGGCPQLHICRYFGHCRKKDCHCPHNLLGGTNRRIVAQWNCQNIDPFALIPLIKLYYRSSHHSIQNSPSTHHAAPRSTNTASSSVQSKPVQQVFERTDRTRPGRVSRGRRCNRLADRENPIQPISMPTITTNTNYQIDISFPSISDASHITIETIESFLRSRGLFIEKKFNPKTTERFHRWTLQFEDNRAVDELLANRWTLQFEDNSAVDELLARPVIPFRGFYLKFKRTNPLIDSKSFVLHSTVDLTKGPITIEKFSSYIDILIDHCSYKLIDLSTPSEQVLLIQCTKIIDFDQLYRVQKSRRQVQGRNITLKQVYEIDTAVIEFIQTSLSPAIVQNIIASVSEDIFTFTIESYQTALVEFIHTDALKQWLSISDITKQKFNVDIKPNIQCVDKDDRKNTSRRSSASQSIKSTEDNTVSQVTINLNRGWAMVAGHRKFGIEYKNYIRSETGFEIDIRGNRVQIRSTSTSNTFHQEQPSSLLNNRTTNFMQKFVFRSISLQQPQEQLAILRAHLSIVAFRRNRGDNYLLAARNSDIEYLMQKLLSVKPFEKKPIDHRPSGPSTTQKPIKPVNQKQTSTFAIPPPLMNLMFTEDETSTTDDIVTESMILPFNTPAQIALFSDKIFENYLQTYFDDTYLIKLNIELMTDNNRRRIMKMAGRQSAVDDALEEFLHAISLFRTKTFNEITDLNWLKISDATRVIQHRLNLRNIICVCQHQTSPFSILVHHIDEKHMKLGVSEQVIENLCQKQLIVATCKPMRIEKEWTILKTDILKRGDYGKDICFSEEQQIITLYGVSRLVKDLQQQFDSINKKVVEKHSSVPIIAQTELIKAEKPPISNPRNLNIENPPIIIQKPQIRSIVFDIDEPGFEVLINQEIHQLLAIVESKCSLEKQILHHQIQIPIPRAKVYELEDDISEVQTQETNLEPSNDSKEASADSNKNWFVKLFQSKKPKTPPSQPKQQQSPTLPIPLTSVPNTTPSVTIGRSKIMVCTGDLTRQAVDLIVVCSTSKILCDTITSAAGSEVEKIYNQQSSCSMTAFETAGGNLPCKQIIFRPWVCDKNHLQTLKQSIDTFIASIITYAILHNLTTIAFPSIGCGQLGHDPKIIAEHMIGETYRQLKTSLQSRLIVSFVLLPVQKNVYTAFADQLNMMHNIDDTLASISFGKQTVKITLTGSDNNVLIECQNKIKILARSSSCKVHLTDKTDMADWPQTIIQKYYEYCLQRRVIPTLDIQNSTLDLIGSKDAVSEVDKYFFQLTAETLRNTRVQIRSRDFIWSVEVSSNKWEEYSSKINQQIENAQMKNLPYVDFTNEKSERCRVIFTNMEEQYQQRKRKVGRKRIDSILPNNWDSSSGNFKRVVLSDSSGEYKDVLNRFNMTMSGQYGKIIKIERIQNERWYKQYAAHRDEFTQRHKQPDERLLFHGCSSVSADKIVQECFNRSFAGVNGVAYGCGVYFHEHAKYSHSYTKQEFLGERTMFLARVLIGKKCIGNSAMKVPPEGFDTTTDGRHIFVVYHDAAAYGEYLIVYK